jgi:sporulation protein YlmC with PRC-barrel domain
MLEYPSLRYIDASHVESGATDLAGFDVRTTSGRKLGQLDGLIVDPPERSIRFAVVQRRGGRRGRRLLVPLSVAQLDVDQKSLQVDVESDADCSEFDAEAFPEFSKTDSQSALLAARYQLPM